MARVADVRPGEGRLVFGAAGVLSGIVAAHVLLETARDALFLTKLPPHLLSLVYVGLAALGFLGARYDQWVSRALGRRSSLILALMSAAAGTMLFYVSDLGRVGIFALYLWTGVVGTLLTIQFWLAAAQRFNPSQGRRLFGLVASGGVVGAVLGGGLGALLAQHTAVRNLLAGAAGVQLLTAWVVTGAPRPTEMPPVKRALRVRADVQTMRESPYLRRIGLLVFVSVGALLVTDYLFKVTMAARFPAAELGVYLARYYALTNVVALVVQLFITMQVLRRAGTFLTLTLLPICLLLSGATAVFLGASLLAVLLAKGADGALRHSLHRVSSELLFLPLEPDERALAKSFFDSVLTRVTQGLFAVGLFVLASTGLDSPRLLGSIVAALAFFWVLTAWSLRAPYLERFRLALGRSGRAGSIRFAELNLDSVEVLVEALSSPEEERVVGAMGLFHQGGRAGLIPALVLYHPSPRVLVRALEVIPAPGRKDWVPLAERLTSHPDFEVRLGAVRALGSTGRLDLLDTSSFEEPRLRATAAFFVAGQGGLPHENERVAEFLTRDAAPEGQVALLEAIARYGNRSWADVVLALHALGRGELDRAVPRAMAKVRDPRFVPLLVGRLGHREGRELVRSALVGLGEPALVALSETVHDRKVPVNVRLHVPRAIARFGTPRARDLLVEILGENLPGAIRYKALRGLGRLVQATKMAVDPERILPLVEQNLRENVRMELALRVLFSGAANTGVVSPSSLLFQGLLVDKRNQALERATRLLGLLHPREDLRRVYYALLSGEGSSRIAAAEILEVLGLGYDPALRALLRVAVESRTEELELERLEEVLEHEPATAVGLLEKFLDDEDSIVSSLAAAHAAELDEAELGPRIEKVSQENDWFFGTSHGVSAR